jgi:hypothetical protein
VKRVALLLFVTMSAFGAGRELAPPRIGATPNYTSEATTAYANGRFLTVWQEVMGEFGIPLMGILHDGKGQRITPRAFPILESAVWVKLVGAGNSFALFWSDRTHSYLTDIDRNGRVLQTTPIDVPITMNTEIAWNDTRFLVFDRQYVPTVMTQFLLLTRAGALVEEVTPLPSNPSGFSVSAALRGFTLTTYEPGGEACARRVNNAGVIEWTACTAATLNAGRPPVSAAVADRGVLMIWTGADEYLRSAVVRDGTFGEIRTISTSRPIHPVHLGPAGDRFLLTFTNASDWPLKSLAVYPDGSPGATEREVTPPMGRFVSVASSGDATLVVFNDLLFYPRWSEVIIANDGTATAPRDAKVGSAVQSQPALADVGPYFLAVWSDAFERDAQLVSSAFRTGDEALWDQPADHGLLASTELPSNGSELLVLSETEVEGVTKMQASFLAPDGDPRDTAILGDTDNRLPMRDAAAIWTGEQWLAVWSNPARSDLDVAVVRDRALQSKGRLDVATPVEKYWGRSFPHLALAHNATTTLFVWTEKHDPLCSFEPPCGTTRYRTYAARVNADGTLASAPLELPSSPTSLSAATSGEEFVVVTGGVATVIDAGVRRVLRSTALFDFKGTAGDVTWTGLDYAVALRVRLAKWYVTVTHLDRAGNVIGAPRGVETLPAQTFTAPSIASDVVALQEGDWTRGAHAVVYEESQLAPLPPPPAHPVPRIVQKEPHWFEITWDAVPGAELYFVDLPEDTEWWVNRPLVRPDEPLRVFAETASVRVTAMNPGGTSSPPPRRRASQR